MPDVIQGPYLRDLLDQPRALQETLEGLGDDLPLRPVADRLRSGGFDRVVLTGMGSSFHALHPLNVQLVSNGFTALVVETSELIHYLDGLLGPRTLLIAVSQSGRSVEAVRLLERTCGSFLIGVTNTAGSPLAAAADAAVLTHAGEEFSVASKTYVATLLGLAWLGGVLCGLEPAEMAGDLAAAPAAAAEYLNNWKSHVHSLQAELAGVSSLFLAGRGASLAAAATGGLIIKEATHFPAEGMSCAAFRHGPMEMIGQARYVIVFAGDDRTAMLNRGLFVDVRKAGGRAALVGQSGEPVPFGLPPAPAAVRPILEILPIQMATLALAALAGREAGRFERLAKITTTE